MSPKLSLIVIDPPRREPEIPERLIQLFLSQNLHLLGLGQLELVTIEHPLPNIGRIDILAKTADETLYAIEVKRGVATRDAIGQLQSYVGTLMNYYPDAKVHGVLVAANLDAPAEAALFATPTIDFWSYQAHFNFSRVQVKRPQTPPPKQPDLPPAPPPEVCRNHNCRSTMLAVWRDDGRTYCRKCGTFLSQSATYRAPSAA